MSSVAARAFRSYPRRVFIELEDGSIIEGQVSSMEWSENLMRELSYELSSRQPSVMPMRCIDLHVRVVNCVLRDAELGAARELTEPLPELDPSRRGALGPGGPEPKTACEPELRRFSELEVDEGSKKA